MSAAEKKVVEMASARVNIGAAETREFLMTLRQTLIMQLAGLEKLLKIRRKCKHCGNAL